MNMTDFINGLPENAPSVIALGLLIINLRTGEEQCINALLVDDRLETALKAVKNHFGREWSLYESWSINCSMPEAIAA